MALQVIATTLRFMTERFDDDNTHAKLILAFLEYSKYNERFETYGFNDSSVRARNALTEIGKLIKIRREEIFQKKLEIHGHPRKGITPANPNDRRQRKLDRARQKQQAQKDDNTN
jgi:hypothetical protein